RRTQILPGRRHRRRGRSTERTPAHDTHPPGRPLGRVTHGPPLPCLAALPAAAAAPILGAGVAAATRAGGAECLGCGAERGTEGDPAWRTRSCAPGAAPPCAGRAAVRSPS